MNSKRAFLTLCGDAIAPRFDMTAEGCMVSLESLGEQSGTSLKDAANHLILAHTSSEELCDVIIKSGVSVVVCCGIEEDYYHYLRWKRIEVIADVAGPLDKVLERLGSGALQTGDCLFDRP